MASKSRSIAPAVVCALSLECGTPSISAQAIVDSENRYPNVGALMVWRVDDAGNPVELRGFASGTLIRDRVMVTAGHFTAPANALGLLPNRCHPEQVLGECRGGYQGALAAYERQLIEAGLKETGGNISEASRLLRLSRNALKRKIRSYGL